MSEFEQHMRNIMKQDQVEAMFRDYLKQMSNTRIMELGDAGADWLEANPPEERHGTLPVPADIAQAAVAFFMIRLAVEINNRMLTAKGGA